MNGAYGKQDKDNWRANGMCGEQDEDNWRANSVLGNKDEDNRWLYRPSARRIAMVSVWSELKMFENFGEER